MIKNVDNIIENYPEIYIYLSIYPWDPWQIWGMEKLPKYHSIKVLFNTKGSRNMEQQRATGVSNVAGHYHEREQYFIWDLD